MRKLIVFTCLCLAVQLAHAAPPPWADREERENQQPGREPGPAIELRKAELNLAERQQQLDMQREMGRLEIQKKRMEIERMAGQQRDGHPSHCRKGGAHVVLACVLLAHLLLAGWIYTDIRKRNAGSGVWIILALLTGFLGSLLYVLVRLGDNLAARDQR